MVVFNEIHNQHLQTSVGIVSVLTENNKRVYKNIKDHGTDITYENEFKVEKMILLSAYNVNFQCCYQPI